MPKREPEFMKELHKIRADLSKKWEKIPTSQLLKEFHEAGKWLKLQIRSAKTQR